MTEPTTTCPNCGATSALEQPQKWVSDDAGSSAIKHVPAVCPDCGCEFWVGLAVEAVVVGGDEPIVAARDDDLAVGDRVTVVNGGHDLHGRVGEITAKKPAHYRVVFSDRQLLLPKQWVKKHDS